MNAAVRKKSPRAPSMSLEDALTRVQKVYSKERRHEAPTDVVAKDMGFSSNTSGTALQALACMRYYGLMHRPKEGFLAVSQEVETYLFSPDPSLKQQLLINWLKTPPVFSDLLTKFPDSLPSDGVIKFELIQMGFTPSAADDCLAVFRKSTDFARYYENHNSVLSRDGDASSDDIEEELVDKSKALDKVLTNTSADAYSSVADGVDRIPVRLAGGRKAWLEIPTPFYEADKKRLIDHVNLIFTNDDASDLI